MRVMVVLVVFVTKFELIRGNDSTRIETRNEVGVQRNNTFSYINVLQHNNSYLNVEPILRTIENRHLGCQIKCLEEDRCFSFNVASTPAPSTALYWCEILADNKYNSPNKFGSDSSTAHHFSIAENLSSQPVSGASWEVRIDCDRGLENVDRGRRSRSTFSNRPTADVNECAQSPCHVKATCNNTFGSFVCTCITGYSGDGLNCIDVNECAQSPCHVKATCNNAVGSFVCTCITGYSGDGFNCIDVNECASDSNDCSEHAICTNTQGSHTCQCKSGYTGNGQTCSPVNPFHAVFTTLGASGRLGPASLGTHYQGQPQDGQVTLSSGIQLWTVPSAGQYKIQAIGATGGYDNIQNSIQYRGKGARITGTYTLNQGEVIKILVGQEGSRNTVSDSSAGGGGSFVVRGGNPLIVAGGGGGIQYAASGHTVCSASTTTTGNPGHGGSQWQGGTGGQGATAATQDTSFAGGGGGGFSSSGGRAPKGGEGGRGFLQGGAGGLATSNNVDGGFGGGGGTHGAGGGAGGGGGYSGGGSGDDAGDSCGGGGGSFNGGTDQTNECCYNSAGHGQVIITRVYS